MSVIYDIGSNNGDDIPYYLEKADVVVAIEANPALTDLIKKRFAREISAKRVHVETCAITVVEHAEPVSFYVHNSRHVRSQMGRPGKMENFTEIKIAARSMAGLLAQYGKADFMKIDIEGFDIELLEYLYRSDQLPGEISVEAHNPRVLGLLIGSALYRAYNVVDGRSVGTDYAKAQIKTRKGKIDYRFPTHSAGPFGDDITTPWLSRHELMVKLAADGFGWKDIHASATQRPASLARR
jgi:FkbM family methyltransferase